MAVDNPFEITYGGQAVGGTSDDYQLHGPYVIDKSYDVLRMVFDVIVVASSYATLHSLSDVLEVAFRKRDQNLVVSIDGTLWTYTFGTTLLNSEAEITKAADPETDRGVSRAYTVTVTAELPAEEDTRNGLRVLQHNVSYEAGRQKVVTMRGLYTAVALPTPQLASVQYLDAVNGFDPVAATLLTGVDAAATFELVAEEFTPDRNDHTCEFSRQYVELLVNQSQALLDDLDLRDHRVVFTDVSQHPGDGSPDVHRLRRVIGAYDCAVDIDVTTDMQAVFRDKVRPHVVALFQTEFSPSVFCVEDKRVGYDETAKRMSVSIQFLYQSSAGSAVVEVASSFGYRESRTIDYTPLHDEDELAFEADPGWATVERVSSRTVTVVGLIPPRRRIGVRESAKIVEPFSFSVGGGQGGSTNGQTVKDSGWNVVQNSSQIQRRYVGDPENESQLGLTILTETLVERLHKSSGSVRRGLFTIPTG